MAFTSAHERWLRILARSLAIGIAVAGLLDPAITSTRRVNAVVSVLALEPLRDSASALRVSAALASRMRVVPARFGRADATVLVGDGVPREQEGIVEPTFAVAPDGRLPSVRIVALQVPHDASLHARVSVTASMRVQQGAGQLLRLSLRADGLQVDTSSLMIRSADTVVHATLVATPTALGATLLGLRATLGSSAAVDAAAVGPVAGSGASRSEAAQQSTDANAVVVVRDEPMSVLVYDPRPSWMSTFVRRAIERDTRFRVTSRIVTSRDLATTSGSAPARLDNAASLDPFAAIVVGSPELLTERDVAGLETFLRRRGGSVLLLLDQRTSGPFQHLAGVRAWDGRALGASVPIADHLGGAALRASELAWPQPLPEGATPIASVLTRAGGTAMSPSTTTAGASDIGSILGRPVIWRTAVGAGQLVVSGALDSWRFRDSTASSFDAYWQSLVADAASLAPPPVVVSLSEQLLRPGETSDLFVSVRGTVLREVGRSSGGSSRGSSAARTRLAMVAPSATNTVFATLETGRRPATPPQRIRLWPDGAIGTFRGTVRAPVTPGSARVVVHVDGSVGEATLLVDSLATRVVPDNADLQRAWIAARKGTVVTESQLLTLAEDLVRRVHANPRPERWYPMRSAWWLLPFALALSGEWWLRRRRGLA